MIWLVNCIIKFNCWSILHIPILLADENSLRLHIKVVGTSGNNQESTIYNQCILWAPLANTWSLCSLKFLYTLYFAVNLLTPRSNLSFSLLLPHNSYNVSSENLVLDQLIIPKLIFSLFSSLIWLIFYWYC